MMTMLDQAARAVHDHWMKNFDHAGLEIDTTPYDDLDDKSKAYALGQARAVLESVRVPSDGFMDILYPDPKTISADEGRAAGVRSRRAGKSQISHFIDTILNEKPHD